MTPVFLACPVTVQSDREAVTIGVQYRQEREGHQL